MLILTRRPLQKIIIETRDGRQIEIVALSGAIERVRLGISAPLDMRIYRPEVADRYPAPPRR